MTLQHFRSVSNYVQQLVVKHHGVYLADRIVGNQQVVLYGVDGFYIETFLKPPAAKVVSLNSFEDPDLLEPYLSCVDLSELSLTLNS